MPCMQVSEEKSARYGYIFPSKKNLLCLCKKSVYEAWILRPKSAKSADIKKRPPKNEDEDGAEEKEPGVEEDSDSEDENAGGDLDDDQLMPFTQSFIFSLLWALGGYLEDSERGKLEAFLRGTVSKSN